MDAVLLKTKYRVKDRVLFFEIQQRIRDLRETKEGGNFLVNVYAALIYDNKVVLNLLRPQLEDNGWLEGNSIHPQIAEIVKASYNTDAAGFTYPQEPAPVVKLTDDTPFLLQDANYLVKTFLEMEVFAPEMIELLKEGGPFLDYQILTLIGLGLVNEENEILPEVVNFLRANVKIIGQDKFEIIEPS